MRNSRLVIVPQSPQIAYSYSLVPVPDRAQIKAGRLYFLPDIDHISPTLLDVEISYRTQWASDFANAPARTIRFAALSIPSYQTLKLAHRLQYSNPTNVQRDTMRSSVFGRLVLIGLLISLQLHLCSSVRAEDPSRQIAHILRERCLTCHGPNKKEGGYSVNSIRDLMSSGDSSSPAVVIGKATQSELYRRLVTDDESERMPAESQPLSKEQIELFKVWIDGGAKVDPALSKTPITQWKEPLQFVRKVQYPFAIPLTSVALHPDKQTAAVSGYGEVVYWQLVDEKIAGRRPTAGPHVASIEITQDGKWIAVSSGAPGVQGHVELWANDSDWNAQPIWMTTSADVSPDLKFSYDSQRLAIAGNDGSLQIVNLKHLDQASAKLVDQYTPHADAIQAIGWSPDSTHLITGSRDRTAKIFHADGVRLIANYDRHQRSVGGVGYCNDRPVSFDETGQLRLWAGDDSDRTVAEQSNLARFLEKITIAGELILVPEAASIRTFQVTKKMVDDGKDDEGKPKQKSFTRLAEKEKLISGGTSWILSVAVRESTVIAGTESGELIEWKLGESEPKKKFLAKP